MTTPVHDPFRGAILAAPDSDPEFPGHRLIAAGLSEEQVDLERARFNALGRQRQSGYAAHAERASDDDLLAAAEELERSSFDTGRLLIPDVLDRVKADPSLLPYALESERTGKARVTLLADLEALVTEQETVTFAEATANHEGLVVLKGSREAIAGIHRVPRAPDAAHRVGEVIDPGGPTGPEGLGDHGTTGAEQDAPETPAHAEQPSLLTDPKHITPATDGATGEQVDDVAPALTPEGTGGDLRTDDLTDRS